MSLYDSEGDPNPEGTWLKGYWGWLVLAVVVVVVLAALVVR